MHNELTPRERAAWSGLYLARRKMERRIEAALQAEHHLSQGEVEVLLLLSWAPGRHLRLSDLAEKSLFTLGGMSQLVDRLERAGLVCRAVAGEDRRGIYAQLTDKGLAKLRAAKATEAALARQHFLSLYDERELDTMASYWRRFLEHDRADAPPCEAAGPLPPAGPESRDSGESSARP
ncbi:MAG: MarR family transcriptional regulator [Chloroflexi bacterium]|nr:MarR family transcriptional regulator [Chloroflexota bacterium]